MFTNAALALNGAAWARSMQAALRIRKKYAAFDAEEKFGIGYATAARHVPRLEGCACGAVMVGKMKPTQCPQFGRGCTPKCRSARSWCPPKAPARLIGSMRSAREAAE